MKTLPVWVQKEIREGTTVQWVGRRARYEFVEELSEAIFRIFIVVSISSVLYRSFEYFQDNFIGLFIATMIVCLMASSKAIVEILNWQNEIYVVVSDEANNGGRLYKFSGWLNRSYITDAIGPNNPTIIADTSWFYRLWGNITGERMERVRLSSPSHTYIEGRRISPQFRRTIHAMSGYKASQPTGDKANLAIVKDIQAAFHGGAIDERTYKDYTLEVLRKAVYQ